MRFALLLAGICILLSGCLEWTDSDRAILRGLGVDVPAENEPLPANTTVNPPVAPSINPVAQANNSTTLTSTSPPAFLHRTVRNCSTNLTISPEATKDLSDGYSNYNCENNYRWQCIADGSFDSYYDEWCEDKYGRKVDKYGRVLK